MDADVFTVVEEDNVEGGVRGVDEVDEIFVLEIVVELVVVVLIRFVVVVEDKVLVFVLTDVSGVFVEILDESSFIQTSEN